MSVNENNPDLKKDKPYQLVIDHIKDDILNGVLKPGDRLPGERESLPNSWGSAAILSGKVCGSWRTWA